MKNFDEIKKQKHDVSIEQFAEILSEGGFVIRKFIVGKQSALDGVLLKNTNFPKNVLIGPLVREDKVILADGNTTLQNNDVLIFIGMEKDIDLIKNQLQRVSWFRRIINWILKIFRRKKD